MDKSEAIIEYLKQCPQIQNNPLFFNFSEAEDNNKQLVTQANEKAIDRPFIDGSVAKRYTFTLIDYRSVIYQPVIGDALHPSENVDDYLDVQAIIDWITEQAELRNYPNFGDKCLIDDMRAVTNNPNLNGIDTQVSPALAIYSFSIQIDYLDISKKVWN